MLLALLLKSAFVVRGKKASMPPKGDMRDGTGRQLSESFSVCKQERASSFFRVLFCSSVCVALTYIPVGGLC